MKCCNDCKISKPLADFWARKGASDGKMGICKVCSRARKDKWAVNHPERIKAIDKRCYEKDPQKRMSRQALTRRLKLYGVTPEQYVNMYDAQGGGCAICHQPCMTKQLSVDHCHQTGKVRALLCDRHNRALGYFDDSPELLRAAAEYLERHKAG